MVDAAEYTEVVPLGNERGRAASLVSDDAHDAGPGPLDLPSKGGVAQEAEVPDFAASIQYSNKDSHSGKRPVARPLHRLHRTRDARAAARRDLARRFAARRPATVAPRFAACPHRIAALRPSLPPPPPPSRPHPRAAAALLGFGSGPLRRAPRPRRRPGPPSNIRRRKTAAQIAEVEKDIGMHAEIPCLMVSQAAPWRIAWDVSLALFLFYIGIFLPLDLAYEEPSGPGWKELDMMIDLFFWGDILLCFRTSYLDDHGFEIFAPGKVARCCRGRNRHARPPPRARARTHARTHARMACLFSHSLATHSLATHSLATHARARRCTPSHAARPASPA